MMTKDEFVSKAVQIANQYKTLYVRACFGAPMTKANKAKYLTNSYNAQPSRAAKITAASSDTFGFDCSGLVKGILWGWDGKLNSTYGGAVYCDNNVPDQNANSMIKSCNNVSTDMSTVTKGELLWKSGHIGIAISPEQCVECTPIWNDGVQITRIQGRGWEKHGKYKYVDYSVELKAGDHVKITGTYYYGGTKKIPDWVKKQTWIVKSIKGDRVVIDEDVTGKYHICSAFYKSDLKIVD